MKGNGLILFLLLSALLGGWGSAAALFSQVERISAEEAGEYLEKLPELAETVRPAALRRYLGSLRDMDGGGVREKKINAVRCALDLKDLPEEAVAGFYAVPPMSDLQRLEDAYPLDGTPMGKVKIIAAKEEYEPGSFVVYPFEDLGKVEFRTGEFKNESGDIFPTENLDLKVVKIWYQNGNAWYSYFGDSGLKLVPELLLNDEDLIRVDRDNPANYARLTSPLDGSVSYQWLTPPSSFNLRFPDHYRATYPFAPMKADFRDASELRPVTLEEGAFKQFFLTAHVTEQIREGSYQGNILMLRDGRTIGSVPVVLRVLPFVLPAPKTAFDLQKDFLVTEYNYITLSMIAEENGGDFSLAEKQMLAIMKNLKAHNQDFHWIRGYATVGSYEYERQIELMKEAGLRTDLIFAMPSTRDSGNPLLLARDARTERECYEELLGHNRVFLGLGDEPGEKWLKQSRPFFRAFQNEGFRFIIAGTDTVFYTSGYFYDFVNHSRPPEDADAAGKWNVVGKAHVAWYAQQHVGVENPAFNRRQYGLTPYLANYSAICNYAHHLGPYNDRSRGYKPMVFAYGSHDGVIDTLQWEGFREGVDDIRYATLLKTLASRAMDSPALNVRYDAGKALQFLAEINSVSDNLNTIRLEMIRHILKLRESLQNEPSEKKD